jgi:hypothetical protein
LTVAKRLEAANIVMIEMAVRKPTHIFALNKVGIWIRHATVTGRRAAKLARMVPASRVSGRGSVNFEGTPLFAAPRKNHAAEGVQAIARADVQSLKS